MDEVGSRSRTALYVAVGAVVLLAAAAGVFFLVRPASVSAPASFTSFSPPEHTFSCKGPAGWETIAESANGIAEGVVFKTGTARIHIIADLQGSLMGDFGRAADDSMSNLGSVLPGMPVIKLPPPVETLHKMNGKNLAEKLSDYEEQPAQAFKSPVGDSRFSEYTADGGLLVGKLHGYRVTMLGKQRGFNTICQCREADWPVLKPVFVAVINSVMPGSG